MGVTSFGVLETAPSALMLLGEPETHGDSIRIKKTVAQSPDHLYLIYISMDNDGLVVKHFWEDRGARTVSQTEDHLINRAVDPLDRPMLTNFGKIVFRKPSWFTIVLDEDDWDFYYPDPTNTEPDLVGIHDPILFLSGKSVLEPDLAHPGKWKKTEQVFSRNRAFYNLEGIDKDVPQNGGSAKLRKALRCINFFTKNNAGEYPGTNGIDFGFNIMLRVPFSIVAGDDRKVTLIIDPDGQNLGPYP